MIVRTLIAAGLAAGLAVTAANAMTVVNSDKTGHEFSFTPKNGKLHRYTLAGHHHRTIDCRSGGTVALGKSVQSCDAKTARIFIKSGKFDM